MKKRLSNTIAPLIVAIAASGLHAGCSSGGADVPPPVTPAPAPTPTPTGLADLSATPPAAATPVNPCALPTKPAATPEETAWQIFVAISCAPASGGPHPFTWETWTEQTCLENPATPGCDVRTAGTAAVRHLHGSRLHRRKLTLDATDKLSNECSPMTTTKASPELAPFVPKNLAAGAKFCEEVFANAPEVAYIKAPAAGQSLMTLTKQQAFLSTSATITFPTESVEVKADWLPATSLSPAGFNCTTPQAGLHVELIDGQCYALVGMHVSSKLLPDWLWATFEPQNPVTNPNRCNPKLYSNCNDPWGSTPATSTGAATQQTPALAALMAQAKLPSALANYRLVGAQTAYGSPTMLGSSFVEFNAEVPPQQASCITCHSYAVLSATSPKGATVSPENPNFGAFPATKTPPFPGNPPVGTPTPLPPPPAGYGPWAHQDFSWLLGVQPPN